MAHDGQNLADRVLARRPHLAGRARFFGFGEWVVILLTGIVISAMVMAGYLRSLEGVRNVEHGRAMALAIFTVTGACVAAALSRLRTRASRVISIGTIVSSFLLIQTPALNRVLHLQPLHRDDWMLVGLAGLFVGCLLRLRDFFGSRIKPTTA